MCHEVKAWPSALALNLGTKLVYDHTFFFLIISENDQTFDPKVHIGHCEIISLFSNFALYPITKYHNMSEYGDRTP